MKVDSAISNAIEQAVRSHGQDPAIARQIVSWYAALVAANESLDDAETVSRRLEILYDQIDLTKVPGQGDEF